MKEEIAQYEEKFLNAFRTSDIEALEELIHDQMIYNNATGEVITKKMDLEEFKASNPIIETLECVEREIQLFDDTAVVSTVVYLKGVFMGHLQVEGKSRFLRTWKKFEDGWKVIGVACVNLA